MLSSFFFYINATAVTLACNLSRVCATATEAETERVHNDDEDDACQTPGMSAAHQHNPEMGFVFVFVCTRM